MAAASVAAFGWGGRIIQGTPPPKALELVALGEYRTGYYNAGAAEIAAFDAGSRRAFLTMASRPEVQIVDMTDPASPVKVEPGIDLTPWGGDDARATSVAVRDGLVAVAVPQGLDDSGPGTVAFFDTSGTPLASVQVGALPDMVTFTPNGAYVLTANEGQPTQDYTVDPDGSVSVIDLREGIEGLTQADVSTIGFGDFTTDPTATGKRLLDPAVRISGPNASVAQDLEPEYLTVSHDSRTAWVTLQENNAIAILDLPSRQVTAIRGLGLKDHSVLGQGLDGGRDDGGNKILTWPVLGMYQPDGIASFRVKGETYLITANEGDVREYRGINEAGTDAVEIEDVRLDPTAFPTAATIQSRPNGIGRLKVTSAGADTDGDGDYDRLLSYGARSFSILRADGSRVYESGDAIEQLTKVRYPNTFNASHTNNTRDDRSDDKGPEPEGVTVAHLFGRTYGFVMLERIGGVLVYELTDPAAPRLVQYVNLRDFTKVTSTPAAGDLGAEAARVVPAEASPTGTPLLLVSNEVSGSLRIFEIAPRQ